MKTYTLEELRLAQAKGCRIEMYCAEVWMLIKAPRFEGLLELYRIHPADEWKARLPRLRDGAEWCNDGDKAPLGRRPFIIGEQLMPNSSVVAWPGYMGTTDCPVPPEFLHPDELAAQPSTPAPDYGEPWEASTEFAGIAYTNRGLIGADSQLYKGRIIACVNAMSGVSDPAAFVAEAKEMQKKITRLEWELAIQRGDIAAAKKIEREGGLK